MSWCVSVVVCVGGGGGGGDLGSYGSLSATTTQTAPHGRTAHRVTCGHRQYVTYVTETHIDLSSSNKSVLCGLIHCPPSKSVQVYSQGEG